MEAIVFQFALKANSRINRVNVLLPKSETPIHAVVQWFQEVSGGLPVVIAVLGCPIIKILSLRVYGIFYFRPAANEFARTENKKSRS